MLVDEDSRNTYWRAHGYTFVHFCRQDAKRRVSSLPTLPVPISLLVRLANLFPFARSAPLVIFALQFPQDPSLSLDLESAR